MSGTGTADVKDEVNVYGKVNAGVSGSLNAFLDLQLRHISYLFEGPDDDMKDLPAATASSSSTPRPGSSGATAAAARPLSLPPWHTANPPGPTSRMLPVTPMPPRDARG
jgi:hypothetical protein